MAVRSAVRGRARGKRTASTGDRSNSRNRRQRRTVNPREEQGREEENAPREESRSVIERPPGERQIVPPAEIFEENLTRNVEEEDTETATSESRVSLVSEITVKTTGDKSNCSMNEMVSLKQIVRSHIFPKMKYVKGPAELAYGSPAFRALRQALSGDVLTGLTEDGIKKWWTKSKRNFVRHQINIRRNNVSRIIKEKFFGTLLFTVCLSKLTTHILCCQRQT